MKKLIVLIIMGAMALFTSCAAYDVEAYVHSKETIRTGTRLTITVATLEDGNTYMFASNNGTYGKGSLNVIDVEDLEVPRDHIFRKSGGFLPLKHEDKEVAVKVGKFVYFVSPVTIHNTNYNQFRVHRRVSLVPKK